MPFPPLPKFSPAADPRAVVVSKNARFTVLTDRIIRLEFSRSAQFEDRPSQVFWHRAQPVPEFSQKMVGNAVEIETAALRLHYRPSALGFTHASLTITIKQSGVTWHYGDSLEKAGNLKGTARTLDGISAETRLEPGLLSRSGWAVVDDSKTLLFNETGWLEPRKAPQKDLYFFGYDQDIAGCLRDFTRLAGPIPMIPRFILGNWWSRYWAYTQTELQGLMEDFRAHEIPLSVCIVDMDWHLTKTRVPFGGWTGYTWNRDLFPDPPAFISWLHSQGLRTALNLHPSFGVRSHEEMYPEMARWMGIDPASRKTVHFDIANQRFAEGYFSILHHPQEDIGVDFWWMDWQQGRHSRLPGLDPLWWLNHLHYYDLARGGKKRPFVFSRWGGLGNHRYPIGFSGDTIIGWEALAYQPYFTATAANVAYGWWSHDIGGHMGRDVSPELYLRWIQFGVFSPIFRIHSTNKVYLERRPWTKPERIEKAARSAMALRYAFIPYIYSMAWRAHTTGLSLVTPMYYNHMNEPAAFQAADQYNFGTQLVVAPFITPPDPLTGLTTRAVWLPAGHWFDFFTGADQPEGAASFTGAVEDIPVFARAGAIVPLGPKPTWGDTSNPEELDVFLFPGSDGAFELYEDDGETTAYESGAYAVTRLSLSKRERTLTFEIHGVDGDASLVPAARTWRVHLRGVSGDVQASLPGAIGSLAGAYDPAARTFSLDPVTLSPAQALMIEFTV